jgi:hypothetical protein
MEKTRQQRGGDAGDVTEFDGSAMDDVADEWTDYSSMIFSPRSLMEVSPLSLSLSFLSALPLFLLFSHSLLTRSLSP